MNFTVNASTAYLGVAAATCLARTVDEFGNEIVTWEMMYPRYDDASHVLSQRVQQPSDAAPRDARGSAKEPHVFQLRRQEPLRNGRGR